MLRESLTLGLGLRDTRALVYNLGVLASAAVMLGEEPSAARIFGAAEAIRERTGAAIGMTPFRRLRERHLAALQGQLDPEELAAAWAEGRAMTFEQAVE